MRMDDRKTPRKVLVWKPIGTRIRGEARKRWIADIEADTQIIGIKWWRRQCNERAQSGRESLRGGCNTSERKKNNLN